MTYLVSSYYRAAQLVSGDKVETNMCVKSFLCMKDFYWSNPECSKDNFSLTTTNTTTNII